MQAAFGSPKDRWEATVNVSLSSLHQRRWPGRSPFSGFFEFSDLDQQRNTNTRQVNLSNNMSG
jgi:hypothetical protein